MQQQAAAPGGGAAPAPEQAAPRPGGGLIGTIARMVFVWWLMNYLKGGGRKSADQPVLRNLFQRGEPVDISFYIDPSPVIKEALLKKDPIWDLESVHLVIDDAVSKNVTFQLPESAQNNGSLYLHTFVMREGHEFEQHNAFFGVTRLTHYGPKRRETKEKNLLFDEAQSEEDKEEEEEEEAPREIVNYWKPKMTVALVDDFSQYKQSTVPPHLRPLFLVDPEDDYYYPMIYFNEFWVLKSHMIEVNSTVDEVTIELTVSSIKPWLVQIISQVEESFRLQASMGLNTDDETDEFKKILVEGNPILLGITFVVSLLHSFFDFLAFKNDIGFWKDNRSMEGLSARSILINAACQFVIFLYLMDNDTSFVVLLSSGVGLLIEIWKITKAMKVTVQWRNGIPVPHFEDRASYSNSETKKHDAQAMKYLSYVIYPLVIGYSIYALVNESHKSWYSWILSSLVGAVYAFGFILMCPQLYLNYKLKSVAHLPWRQLTYKFLNTIIDDLFAFVITMPWLHRLSVFRDDVVFLIYLYQWYVYGVDKKRVNEFGFSEESSAAPAAPADDGPCSETEAEETEPPEEQTEEGPSTPTLRHRREPAQVEEIEPPKLHDAKDESKKDK